MLKTAAISTDANHDGLAGVGDQVTFTFHIENTGNVTMTGISVDDQLVAPAGPAVSVTCPSTTLAPGADMDCTSSAYAVTQADVDAESVQNSATASGNRPQGPGSRHPAVDDHDRDPAHRRPHAGEDGLDHQGHQR